MGCRTLQTQDYFRLTSPGKDDLPSLDDIILPSIENSSKRLEFSYDYMGRRISKKVWKWVGGEKPIVIPPEVQAQIDRINTTRDRLITQITATYDAIIANLQKRLASARPILKRIIERQITLFETLKTDSVERINSIADSQITRIYTNAGIDPNAIGEGEPEWKLVTDEIYAWDGWNLIGTFSVSPLLQLSDSFLHGEEGILAETRHATSKTYLACRDGNRNITAYINASDGNTAASYEYSPSGSIISKSGSEADKMMFRFAGYAYDKETGWSYLGHRYYDADRGRFASRDPIGEAGGVGLYVYGNNDPVNNWDYLGLKIQINHPLKFDEFLKKHNVQAIKDENYVWELFGEFSRKDLTTEILGTMLKSTTTFKIECIEGLKKHIDSRISVINAARSAKFRFHSTRPNYKLEQGTEIYFGERKPGVLASGAKLKEAVGDLWKRPHLYTLDCTMGAKFVMIKGLLDVVDESEYIKLMTTDYQFLETIQFFMDFRKLEDSGPSKNAKSSEYWIPGDLGYLNNPLNNNDVFQGENLIYLGNGKYWGHGGGEKDFVKWHAEVSGWVLESANKSGVHVGDSVPEIGEYVNYLSTGLVK